MQKAYINSLYELMRKDKNVISVLSDSGTDYDELLKSEFPDQCVNLGIAEENVIGVAAGLAAGGKIPFVYTSGAFLAYRAYEFIRDDVCLQDNNVKIIGMGSGLAWSTLGPSHHTTEDISALRAIPNLVVLSPASPGELTALVKFAYKYRGPVYIRMGMSGEKEIYPEGCRFELQKNVLLRKGEQLAFMVTGSIVNEVMEAADILENEGVSVTILNVPSIKPFDVESIVRIAASCEKLITVEEHNIYGGIGSIAAEIIAEQGLSLRLYRIGLKDCFGKGYGTLKEVRAENGLDAKHIVEAVKEFGIL